MATTAHAPTTAQTFDELGLKYEQAFATCTAQQRHLRTILSHLPAGGGARVLDLGSGTGKPAAALFAGAGHTVTGIDVAPEMVRIASAQVPGAVFEVGDARTWEPRAEAAAGFDAVVCCFSLIAGVSREDIRGVFGRVARWLRPGGWFLYAALPMEWEAEAVVWMGRPVVVSALGVDETVAAVKGAGLEVVLHEVEEFLPRAVEAGICEAEQVFVEPQLFVIAQKPA